MTFRDAVERGFETWTDGVVRADGLLDAWPEAPDALDRVRRTALADPLYRNTLLSSDGIATTIVIELDGAAGSGETSLEDILEFGDDAPGGDSTGDGTFDAAEGVRGALLTTEQADELVSALEPIMAESSPGDSHVYVSGTPLLAQRIGAMLTRDITVFFAVSFALSGVVLLLLFRTSWGVVLPLLVVGLSVVGTLGGGWVTLPDRTSTYVVGCGLITGATSHGLIVFTGPPPP